MIFLHNGQPVEICLQRMVNAGYAGCDQAVVKAHIEELAAIGVSVPKHTPTFYPVPVLQLTQAPVIQVGHNQTSAEVEYVWVQSKGRCYITVGSDHSDRALETYSVNAAKQICPNVVAAEVWDYQEVCDHMDQLVLKCEVLQDGQWRLYQNGPASALLRPDQLLTMGGTLTYGDREGFVLYSGTIPTIGTITYASKWRISLEDKKLDRRIVAEYTVEVLPDCIE